MIQLQNIQMLTESIEAEKLEALLQEKKEYFAKLENDFARKKVQEEILLLQSLLPIILNETTLFYNEITKALTEKIHAAVKKEANAIMVIIPLHDSTGDSFRLATINPHWGNPYEGLEIVIGGRNVEEVRV